MSKAFTITMIGSGNVAWHLAPALDNTEFVVRQVYSRKAKNADKLVSRLYEAEATDSLDFSSSNSNVFILALPDNVLSEVMDDIILPDNSILIHTSGSMPLGIVSEVASQAGVFYPLQTFTKEKKINFGEVPIFIESSDKETGKLLMRMGKAISSKVFPLNEKDRKSLHIAAIFASNFTNHMLTIAQEMMHRHKFDYDWLKPLIAETLNKSFSIGPEKAQTGPARRGDVEILDEHIRLLKGDKDWKSIYKVISQHILDHYESYEDS